MGETGENIYMEFYPTGTEVVRNMQQFGLPDPYFRAIDYVKFTDALVLAGYRPYYVRNYNTNEMTLQGQIVWAQSMSDIDDYLPSSAPTPLRLEKGSRVDPGDVIIVSKKDGGYINAGGHIRGIRVEQEQLVPLKPEKDVPEHWKFIRWLYELGVLES